MQLKRECPQTSLPFPSFITNTYSTVLKAFVYEAVSMAGPELFGGGGGGGKLAEANGLAAHFLIGTSKNVTSVDGRASAKYF